MRALPERSEEQRVIERLAERRSRHLSAGWNWNQLEPKLGTECLQVFENMVARDGIEKHYTSSFPLTEFSCIRLHESPRTRPETYRSQSILQVNLRSKLLLQWRPRSIEPWPRWPRKACLQEPRPQHAYPDRLSPGTLLISEDNAKRNHLAGFLMARRS